MRVAIAPAVDALVLCMLLVAVSGWRYGCARCVYGLLVPMLDLVWLAVARLGLFAGLRWRASFVPLVCLLDVDLSLAFSLFPLPLHRFATRYWHRT